MKNRSVGFILVFVLLILTACDYRTAKPVFDISGSPDPLYYGGSCPTPVMTFTVKGPGEGLKINSIEVTYQLIDGSGKKITEANLKLYPVPGAAPVEYDADRIIVVPDTGDSVPAIDSPSIDFGEGKITFVAFVDAVSVSAKQYFLTSTKSIPVLPCLYSLRPPGIDDLHLPPPDDMDKPKESDEGAPPAPPSCSVEPNNPSCVP